MLNYEDLDEILLQMQTDVCAAECHGFICGQICNCGQADPTLWWDFLDAQLEDDELANECCKEIQELSRTLAQNMQLPYFEFQLLLPSDGTTLAERVDALGEWCQGFLNGFDLSSIKRTAPLTDNCLEVLDDFLKICQVEVGSGVEESDEQALMELVEYVRIGTIMIFEELHSDLSPGDKPEVLH